MTKRIVAESAFQIALFLGIVAIGLAVRKIAERADLPGAGWIGMAVTMTLIMTLFLGWERIFNRFWPRTKP